MRNLGNFSALSDTSMENIKRLILELQQEIKNVASTDNVIGTSDYFKEKPPYYLPEIDILEESREDFPSDWKRGVIIHDSDWKWTVFIHEDKFLSR